MRISLLLPTLWLFSFLMPVPRMQGQGRPLGPWRLTYQTVTEGAISGWENGPTPGRKVVKLLPTAVRWNITPDSIRLFLNCENPLIAPTKPRKELLPIRFTATGATVRLDAKHQRLLIVPSESVVILSAYRGQTLIFKHRFQAIPPPLPMPEPWIANHRNVIWCKGPPPDSTLTHITLSIKAISDASLATFMPNDALYRVASYQITLLHNGISSSLPQVVAGPQVGIEKPRDTIYPGDQVQIEIQRIARKNFRGDVEFLPSTRQFIVALPL